MRKILIYHIGSIGDTLVIAGLLQQIRQLFDNDRLYFVCNTGTGKVLYHRQLLEPAGLVDEFLDYPSTGSKYEKLFRFMLICRKQRFDMVINLRRQGRSDDRIFMLDHLFFRACGIAGIHGCVPLAHPARMRGVDIIARRLSEEGIHLSGTALPDVLKLTAAEKKKAADWFTELALPASAIPIAVGIGGKQPVCHWPLECYAEVLSSLHAKHQIVPIFFGGDADSDDIARLRLQLPAGYSALPARFDLRESMAAMGLCRCYLGNDTGSIHMAATAGLPCVGIYSSHDPRGYWFPIGEKHLILQTPISCEGCRKQECHTHPAECIAAISPAAAVAAIEKVLKL